MKINNNRAERKCKPKFMNQNAIRYSSVEPQNANHFHIRTKWNKKNKIGFWRKIWKWDSLHEIRVAFVFSELLIRIIHHPDRVCGQCFEWCMLMDMCNVHSFVEFVISLICEKLFFLISTEIENEIDLEKDKILKKSMYKKRGKLLTRKT